MSRLIVVSNRVNPPEKRTEAASGGLAVALAAALKEYSGFWFGWSGETVETFTGELKTRTVDEVKTVTVDLDQADFQEYYNGYANSALWPLFHYTIDKVRLEAEDDWRAYQRVNQRFAEALAAHARPGDLVWIHDYHLALVPELLRRLAPGARIGFFLHIPFPSSDVFRILPWREEILRGLLGADLVGFHTAGYRHNFAHAAAIVLGIEIGTDTLVLDDRTVRIGVYPISIDSAAFARAAAHPEVQAEVEKLRAETGGKRIVLGILFDCYAQRLLYQRFPSVTLMRVIKRAYKVLAAS